MLTPSLHRILGAAIVTSAVDMENGENDALYGNLAALVSAGLSGLYSTLLKKKLPNDDDVDMSVFLGKKPSSPSPSPSPSYHIPTSPSPISHPQYPIPSHPHPHRQVVLVALAS